MIGIRQCTHEDLATLQSVSLTTFRDAFATMNTEANMNAYLQAAFDLENLRKELLNPLTSFYFIYLNGELAGYLKLNMDDALTDIHDPRSLEIERIFVLKDFQGAGIGSCLMDKALEVAREHNKSFIWLGVWERNEPALRFYRKNGFYHVGEHVFVVGEDRQNDLVMRKDL
jgi:diamine N-acetyltransferase